MQITYQGHAYTFDQRKIAIDEWRELKRKYKMTPKAFEDGLPVADPDAMTFLYWVMLRQSGMDKGLTLGDHLKPDLIELNGGVFEATKAELAALEAAEKAEPEPEPVPTVPSLVSSPSPTETPGPAPSLTRNGRGVTAPITVS